VHIRCGLGSRGLPHGIRVGRKQFAVECVEALG
jgi:hypothetical protein